MEDNLVNMISQFGILNLPFVSLVFNKDDIDKIVKDNDTYQRNLTTKCPFSVIRQIMKFYIEQQKNFFFENTYHAVFYDDDNKEEICKRKYISKCFENRVSDKEITTIRKMLSEGNSDIHKYILKIFLRRILKTKKIPEIDDLVANVIPLEKITTKMMQKYNLHRKIPQVELNLLISATSKLFVPLVITNETVHFTKRSPLPATTRVCCRSNSQHIPIGNIVILITGIPTYLEDNPKYIWGAGIDHRCCRIRDFAIDFFDKLNKKE
jgi:hypothetical protein